ncbi:MAG: ABC transporter substrate-binding protein [Oscillospiraceae bacterium]|nr:ABC transporter substrate-binding protein [Oscillospiraceae bacterium]
MCALTFSACSGSSTSSSSSSTSSSTTESSSESSSSTESTTSSEESSSALEIKQPEAIKVAALKGPTAMGMTKLMDDDEKENLPYEFTIAAAADELSPLIAQGKVDIACVPANLGAVLYKKTEGKISALAVNTLGVLYLCENGDTVKSIADLKGKTIYSAGKGATPEYALNFIIKSNGLENDVNIEWKSEHAECLAALLANENSVAMLPQPFVTTAQMKNEGVRVAIDLNDAWDDLNLSSSLLTGIVVVRKEFAENYPEATKEFLNRYAASVKFVNENIDEAAELVGKYDIVPAAVAKKAIPNCHIVCISGDEMKTMLSGYLQVLFDQLPASVGGAMPADDFYYTK